MWHKSKPQEEPRAENEHLVKLGASFPGEWVLIESPGSPWGTDGSVKIVDHDFDPDALAKRFWGPRTWEESQRSGHFFQIPPHRYGLEMAPPCPDDELCRNCRSRLATIDWVGDGGVLAWTHGMSSRWCELCALRAQVQHCREAAGRLPELEAKLEAELEAELVKSEEKG